MLSIIIVNYNGRDFLRECLESVRRYAPLNSEIIIHDNGSCDGSVAFVKQNFFDVLISESANNLGFVGGNNVASKLASGNYLLLLNSDTVVRNSLQPMINLLELNPNLWAVGCRLVYGDGTQQESIGQRLGLLRLILSWSPLACFSVFRRTLPANSPLYKLEYVDCDWISGACLLTSRNRWQMLGGFDEKYFMYMEDVDYCERIRQSGGAIVYTASTVVTHLEGAGRPWIGRRALFNTAKSYVIYASKFYGLAGLALLCLTLPPLWCLRSLAYLFLYLICKDKYGAEKSFAYLSASFSILITVFKFKKQFGN